MRCFEEDEESCLPKSDEVLVVIENMIIGFKLARVCVRVIYIYIRARCSSLMSEGKKVVVWCLVLLFSQPSKLFDWFFEKPAFCCFLRHARVQKKKGETNF